MSALSTTANTSAIQSQPPNIRPAGPVASAPPTSAAAPTPATSVTMNAPRRSGCGTSASHPCRDAAIPRPNRARQPGHSHRFRSVTDSLPYGKASRMRNVAAAVASARPAR